MNTTRTDTNIWPGLTYTDPLAARDWLRRLGFEDGIVVEGDGDGEVVHSEMLWPDGGRVMIHSACKQDKTFSSVPGSGNLYVVVADPDAVYARAKDINATLVRDMAEEDYGSRGFSVADPEGNTWSFGTYAG
ncbi:Glyoxalase/bleomycin resistance protein/dioxygenase OS=Tsukamurella paurometabola (strain ATCC 8368/ DSM / CCUG 35730 / CIP 100753 / JCM 10117 / KCTC 9821/ NBRC 16120 / NCIMB 702349 / NCTC 13040) OX=521096 GN=Tpau_1670 PE=4 SV=1 [Tsukamurella paurometabola]|uniref:Glyoxalase/bleomycin resistance protein/dioxygenase n=1 Tax=Tsukamurella paurometabola (strain ATCC 8368 / DSM 20162 / CCUG 35730 / CIP 100753 / JCM 10117 / KCTC 9821 / NBRC 16120 / NCIMB 702349 / NCTC 13040) TaxID=521096 RepID=D5UM09_TSUPD|nr:VOC family protein [Tsukamurella paurometabola]ADG78289.1 Glyoxalase/bleomycin resistance protein/dioxygenase [Tsukamurella paurometabola DSM 20162]SUP31063.1 Glyoxalase-like domain [Tsukamurella paurometabola]